MKIIDLLNKIANGDKEIKNKYELKINTYLHCHYVPECLNDELIEEDKKIEKLDTKDLFTCDDYQNIKLNFALTWIKINEIIDYIMEDK